MMKTPELTLFYDGNCLFCLAEMKRLRHWNRAGKLDFVDIAQADFDPSFLGVSLSAMNAELHSLTKEGRLLVGIESMLQAYTLIDKAWVVFPLRIAFLRPVMSYLYRKFARHRYTISALLGHKPAPTCHDGVCENKRLF